MDQNPQDFVPQGFTLEPIDKESFVIHMKRTGMGCANAFLIVWLSGWTVGCVMLLRGYLGGGQMSDGDPIPLWFLLIFLAAEVYVACLIVYLFISRKSFQIDRNSLVVATQVLGLRWGKRIRRDSIKKFVQIKDGGDGDDSFPSWGLTAVGDRKAKLIYRQPFEKSHWLGGVLAKWAGVDFVEAAPD
ncbi:MAG: hypothetical protein ACI8UO_000639 [Verrucomicrobiales bacterium]|jgi:hypothetical protein